MLPITGSRNFESQQAQERPSSTEEALSNKGAAGKHVAREKRSPNEPLALMKK